MANIVIASNDPLCQSAKNWFINTLQYKEGPPITSLQNGETLIIIAHDTELGDASGFLQALQQYDHPMTTFNIKLIVCSAASHQFGKDLVTPAERIANHFQRHVFASKNLVFGTWDATGATFRGDYIDVPPNTDITSLVASLHL